MAPSQLETGGQKAVQGTVLDAKSRLSALIKAGFSRFHKVPTSLSIHPSLKYELGLIESRKGR